MLLSVILNVFMVPTNHYFILAYFTIFTNNSKSENVYNDNANVTAAVDVRSHSVHEHLPKTNSKADINNYLSDAGATGPQVTRHFWAPIKTLIVAIVANTEALWQHIILALKKIHWKVALRVPMSINHHRQKLWFWRENFEKRVREVSINVVVRYWLEKSCPIALKYASDENMPLVIRLM